jgi:hypothetical protein
MSSQAAKMLVIETEPRGERNQRNTPLSLRDWELVISDAATLIIESGKWREQVWELHQFHGRWTVIAGFQLVTTGTIQTRVYRWEYSTGPKYNDARAHSLRKDLSN